MATKSKIHMRSTRLYPKHEASSFMELFTNLIRITLLVRLSLPLLLPCSTLSRPSRNGHQTMSRSISARQACNENNLFGLAATSLRSDCNPRGRSTPASTQNNIQRETATSNQQRCLSWTQSSKARSRLVHTGSWSVLSMDPGPVRACVC